MQLFNLINGWAGRSDVVDNVLRFFYVAALPLVATLLAALLILLPRGADNASRRRIAYATCFAVALCAATMYAIDFATGMLKVGTLSPRPFLTHWVNALIVEPNDNSFPSAEAILALIIAVMLVAARPRFLPWSLLFALLFVFTRVFCGTNYPEDVIAGGALGFAFSNFALGVCRVPLRLRFTATRSFLVQPRALSLTAIGLVLLMGTTVGVELWKNDRIGPKMRTLFVKKAAAQPVAAHQAEPLPANATRLATTTPAAPPGQSGNTASREVAPAPIDKAAAIAHEGMHEAEMPPPPLVTGVVAGKAEADGHVVSAEIALATQLAKLNLPHRLVSVDVAEIDEKLKPFRCAFVRFEVRANGTPERKRVAETAAAIVKRTFQVDSQVQNVDVVGVVVNGKEVTGPRLVFASGTVPVFTASVQRSNLLAAGPGAWTNAPNIDGGSWLNARSLLYFNARVLPPGPGHRAQPAPTKVPTATPAPAAIATPLRAQRQPVESPPVRPAVSSTPRRKPTATVPPTPTTPATATAPTMPTPAAITTTTAAPTEVTP